MRVGIINRGEVAVRLIRACQELGHETVLFHSTPDLRTPAYRMADETIELQGHAALETYLNIYKVIDACMRAQIELVHPGFGFLSENADFVKALEKTNIKFVGPSSKSILSVGNKIRAKALAQKVGVPVLNNYSPGNDDEATILTAVRKIGFPCLIKPAAGGGGKGMKVVESDADLFEKLSSAKREAQNAFGSDEVFVEKYLKSPRHVEVQILGDTNGQRVHFFERECSIQRRHQKIFEESPASSLTPELRQNLTDAALKIAEAAEYTNAGTVEFLVDENESFYFMEMNTRLQVEHTVTEMVCGIDLVHQQFRIAEGSALNLTQTDISQKGHALEVRIYAENPAKEFLPSTGEIAELILPIGPHRRFDFGYEKGDLITPNYDPMIGKVITWANTREENILRMFATLSELVIFGVHTNIEFLKRVLMNNDFIEDKVSTHFLADHYKEGFKLPPLTKAQKEYADKELLKPRTSSGGLKTLQSPFMIDWKTQ